MRISELDKLQADYCHAISNPRRALLLRILGEGERSVSALVELTGFSPANVSQHLTLLRSRRIVAMRREGGFTLYRLAQPRILEAMSLMREALLESLDRQQRDLDPTGDRESSPLGIESSPIAE
jgi:ArsR family transcriptional regulator